MPEGLLTAAGAVTGAVHDDHAREPEPTADAPRGWTWDRKGGKWKPRQRGAVLFGGADGTAAADNHAGTAGDGPRAGAGDAHDRDPDPSWVRDDQQQQDSGLADEKLKYSDVPGEAKDNAASLAGMLGMPLLAFAQAMDPYCGGALAQNFENIVDHTLPLILRSKKAVAFFTSKDSDWLLWFGLAQSLWPIATCVVKHHVTRSVEVVRDDHGRVYVQPRAAEPDHGDHLTPPPPDFSYQA